MLSGPHLVLTNARSDDHILFLVSGLLIKLFDDFLRFDTGIGTSRLHVGERILLFPLIYVCEPFIARRRPDQRDKSSKIRHNIAKDRDGSVDNLVDILWLNLKMDDTAASLGRCCAGSRRKSINLASNTIIESCTESDDQIGILHCKVGISRTVHTEHVETLLVGLVKGTQALQSGSDRNVALLGKLGKQLGSHGRGQNSVTGIDDRPLCLVDQTGSLLNEDDVGWKSDELQRVCRQGVRSGSSSPVGKRCTQNACSHILWKIYENRSGTTGSSDLEGFINTPGQLGNILDHHIPLGATSRYADDISFLECVRTNGRGSDLSTEDDERDTIGKGVLHGCDDVSCSRT